MLDWAKASGYREGDNPADAITRALPKQQAKVRHLPALPYPDVPAFLETLRDAEAAPSVKLAFEFLVLTAARTSEVLGAQWDEIDQNGAAARLRRGPQQYAWDREPWAGRHTKSRPSTPRASRVGLTTKSETW